MQVDFYQLTRDPAIAVIPAIAQRTLDQKERMLIVSADAEQRQAVSDALWKHRPESFLAHGYADGDAPQRQPILISDQVQATNDARYLVLADGQWRDDIAGFVRVFYFFEAQHIDNARAAWRALAQDAQSEPHYWRQDGRKWIEGPG